MATHFKTPMKGGCQCGNVKYEISEEPLRVYCCHCTECRKQSASAFGISVIIHTDAFRVTDGTSKLWSRTTSNGAQLHCHFCGDCGTRLWHWADDDAGHISVKGGTLDIALNLSGVEHIWVSSKLQGVNIPEHAKTWEGDPE